MSPVLTVSRRRPIPVSSLFATTGVPSLAQVVEDVLSTLPSLPEFPRTGAFPAMNVTEGSAEFTVTAELPGLSAKDLNVDYADGVLTIRGEKTEERTEKEDDRQYHVWERQFGSFQRSFPFPGGIAEDKISSEVKDGVLTVHLPKTDNGRSKRRSIPITAQ